MAIDPFAPSRNSRNADMSARDGLIASSTGALEAIGCEVGPTLPRLEDYIVLSAAAEAIALSVRPCGGDLDRIQESAGRWVVEKYGDPHDITPAEERLGDLVEFLNREHLGSVGLFDLDATLSLLANHKSGPRADNDHSLTSAPALHYLTELGHRTLITNLVDPPEGMTANLTPVESAPPAIIDAAIPDQTKLLTETRERKDSPRFGLRDARLEDIPELVEIDLRSFGKVYKGYDISLDELRSELTEKFLTRYKLLGGKWMPVVTRHDEAGRDKVLGFMIGCPTNKGPEDFESWEKTTDNGTLSGLYDPEGKHLYVVTLSMDPSVQGEHGQDQLYTRLIGRMIESRMSLAYFESRMPGLQVWMRRACRVKGQDFSQLTDSEKMEFAQEYSTLTKVIGGKAVPYDRLLRLYSVDFGCKLARVVPEAYQDGPSMNFGALYIFDNPLPRAIRGRLVSALVGKGVGITSRFTSATHKLMRALQAILR